MNEQDLRKLLEETDDKFNIFINMEILKKYDLKISEFLDLIGDFLNDAEKQKLFDYPFFVNCNEMLKSGIIRRVSDMNIKLQMIKNEKVMNGLSNYHVVDILIKMDDVSKKQILHDQEFIERYELEEYELKNIISSMSDGKKSEILTERELIIDKLHLKNYQIANITEGLLDENIKKQILEIYQMESFLEVDVINTFSDESKIKMILEEKKLKNYDRIKILSSIDCEMLISFLENNKEFCTENYIKPYEIILELNVEQQKKIVEKLEDIKLTENEKREILVILKEEVKQDIDISDLSDEYKKVISISTLKNTGKIILDLDRNLEDYKGLDNLIRVNPQQFNKEERDKFIKLCSICPDLQIFNSLNSVLEVNSTPKEYKETEEWIETLVESIDTQYSDIQKIALVDNAIGKKISYTPDFDTEIFDAANCRAIWKIINSGQGVCNGIALVEKYILDRIGIESEIISGKQHSFLKIINLEVPLENGESIKGNTILDPTWNLCNHRFGAKPENFCRSYEGIRKNDIDNEGNDRECHKNDESLLDATLELDEKSLRKVFTSVGLADKDGQFPIKELLEKSKSLHEKYSKQPILNIENQFLLLSEVCPEFATCQNSSMNILKNILLNSEKLEFNKCVVNRVYYKEDKEKKPNLFVYIDLDGIGEKFYFADKSQGRSIELSKEEFVKQFECYDKDLEKMDGYRYWEYKEQEKSPANLLTSSGNISTKEGDER